MLRRQIRGCVLEGPILSDSEYADFERNLEAKELPSFVYHVLAIYDNPYPRDKTTRDNIDMVSISIILSE